MLTYVLLEVSIFWFSLHFAYGSVIFVDNDQKRAIELKDVSSPCILHTDRDTIDDILQSTDGKNIQQIAAKELDDLSFACSDTNQVTRRGGFFYPGTRWCGPGNIASSYSDLGPKSEEDRCCRDHDHCPNQLEPGQCRHGVCNISPFTRSHCDCDHTFKMCLRESNSQTANNIGSIYFNVVKITCFKDRRLCPQYLRENLSYNWFCEEWKFELCGDFEPTLLSQGSVNGHTGHPLPDIRLDVKTEPPPPSSIEKNLQNLFEQSPNVAKVMESSKNIEPKIVAERNVKNPPFSIFNDISNGELIFRD